MSSKHIGSARAKFEKSDCDKNEERPELGEVQEQKEDESSELLWDEFDITDSISERSDRTEQV